MAAVLLKLDGDLEPVFARCRDVVRAGGVIAYPTDTFYGLGADPGNRGAVKRLFTIKGRKADQPILLLLSDRSGVNAWASTVTPSAELLMDRFWPGPLTLVFRAAAHVLPELTGGGGKIGLRVPGNSITLNLLRVLGTALTGTSANRSGGHDLRTAEEVMAEVGDRIDLVLDGGTAVGDLPSTVVDVSTEPPRIIRQGIIDITAPF
jgi:L-threonylcarbamoyladenylate synthase